MNEQRDLTLTEEEAVLLRESISHTVVCRIDADDPRIATANNLKAKHLADVYFGGYRNDGVKPFVRRYIVEPMTKGLQVLQEYKSAHQAIRGKA